MKPKFRAWTEEGKVMYYDVYPFKDDTLLLSYDEIAFDEVPASDFDVDCFEVIGNKYENLELLGE